MFLVSPDPEFRRVDKKTVPVFPEVLNLLREFSGRSTGQLHRSLEYRLPDRRAFERVLGALAASDLVEVRVAAFEMDGQTIRYQQAS